jgi:hypothetical protein
MDVSNKFEGKSFASLLESSKSTRENHPRKRKSVKRTKDIPKLEILTPKTK